MASSAKSEKLGLSLWEASDMPERLDFRGDNEALENLVGGHLGDTTKHLEAAEKQFVKAPYFIDSHSGTGMQIRNKSYGLTKIRLAIVIGVGHAPVEYDANGKAHVYWDVCAVNSGYVVMGRGGIKINSPRNVITYSKTLEDGTVLHLNDSGTTYLMILVQDIS